MYISMYLMCTLLCINDQCRFSFWQPDSSSLHTLLDTKIPATLMLAFIYDLVVIQSLAGGDLPLKKGPFTTAHYEQKDKSLNNLLWELVPVHLSSMERKLRFGGLELRVACRGEFECAAGSSHTDPPYPAAKLLAAAEAQESWAISANLDMLDLIHDFLKKQADGTFGPSPDDLLQTHSTQFVPRLSSLVPAVEQRKKKINVGLFASGHYVAAMFEYYKCILSLYPWIASPFIFSPEDAFGSGLAHL
jgi:hypothetical protein